MINRTNGSTTPPIIPQEGAQPTTPPPLQARNTEVSMSTTPPPSPSTSRKGSNAASLSRSASPLASSPVPSTSIQAVPIVQGRSALNAPASAPSSPTGSRRASASASSSSEADSQEALRIKAKIEKNKARASAFSADFKIMTKNHTDFMTKAMLKVDVQEQDTESWMRYDQLQTNLTRFDSQARKKKRKTDDKIANLEQQLSKIQQKDHFDRKAVALETELQLDDPNDALVPLKSKLQKKLCSNQWSLRWLRCKRVLGFFLYCSKRSKDAHKVKVETLQANIADIRTKIEETKGKIIEQMRKKSMVTFYERESALLVREDLPRIEAARKQINTEIKSVEEKQKQCGEATDALLVQAEVDINAPLNKEEAINTLQQKVRSLRTLLSDLKAQQRKIELGTPETDLDRRVRQLDRKVCMIEEVIYRLEQELEDEQAAAERATKL